MDLVATDEHDVIAGLDTVVGEAASERTDPLAELPVGHLLVAIDQRDGIGAMAVDDRPEVHVATMARNAGGPECGASGRSVPVSSSWRCR